MKLLIHGRKNGYTVLYPKPTPKEFFSFASDIQSINAIITDNKYIASGTIKESNESSIIGAVTHNHFENVALILSHLLEKHDIKLLNGKILMTLTVLKLLIIWTQDLVSKKWIQLQ